MGVGGILPFAEVIGRIPILDQGDWGPWIEWGERFESMVHRLGPSQAPMDCYRCRHAVCIERWGLLLLGEGEASRAITC